MLITSYNFFILPLVIESSPQSLCSSLAGLDFLESKPLLLMNHTPFGLVPLLELWLPDQIGFFSMKSTLAYAKVVFLRNFIIGSRVCLYNIIVMGSSSGQSKLAPNRSNYDQPSPGHSGDDQLLWEVSARLERAGHNHLRVGPAC